VAAWMKATARKITKSTTVFRRTIFIGLEQRLARFWDSSGLLQAF
jgi:hypothetical protein